MSEEESVSSFFPAPLVPLAGHPLVQGLPPEAYEQVFIQHLYRYLDFTAKLEYAVVNRTALGIARGSVAIGLPREMRLDALKIYCDEAYHTLMSVDLLQQIEVRTGVPARLPEEPFFLKRLAGLLEEAGPDMAPLVELLFVIVSETLISGNLAAIPGHDDLLPAVRDTIQDHANDEGRHHTYFAIFLRHLWGQLDAHTRRQAALYVPRLIHAFLDPDLPALRQELQGYGMAADAVEQTLNEVFDTATVQRYTRASAQQTLRHFAALGVFDDAQAVEAFEEGGLTGSAEDRSARRQLHS
ncbi:diiron oxygenase [Streptomyces sp. NPDC126514]|uniref:diiron oxygenase n=1 Tax=Streptomyces sp. NPDC126514 TaxID=3155210 RepID=UPI0033187B19